MFFREEIIFDDVEIKIGKYLSIFITANGLNLENFYPINKQIAYHILFLIKICAPHSCETSGMH